MAVDLCKILIFSGIQKTGIRRLEVDLNVVGKRLGRSDYWDRSKTTSKTRFVWAVMLAEPNVM